MVQYQDLSPEWVESLLERSAPRRYSGDKVSVKRGDTTLPATMKRTSRLVLITLTAPVEIARGETLLVTIP